MEPRYAETKQGAAVVWGGFGLIFATGWSLLMGDPFFNSILSGIAMGIGFAIGVVLFFKDPE